MYRVINHKKKLAAAGCFISLVACNAFAHHGYGGSGEAGAEITLGWINSSIDNTGYGVSANSTSAPSSGNLLYVEPDSSLQGAIKAFFHFSRNPYTINLSYWKIDADESEAVTGSVGATKAHPAFGIQNAISASSEISHDFHHAELTLSTLLAPNRYVSFTPHIGLSYLSIDNSETIVYLESGGDSASIYNTSEFSGWGISVGTGIQYLFCHRLGLFGNFSYSAHIGDIDGRYSGVLAGSGPDAYSVGYDVDCEIVNVFHSELGLTYNLVPCPTYNVHLMLGYAISKAFDSSQKNVYLPDDVNQNYTIPVMGNTGFKGLFLRFKFGINHFY